MSLRAGFPGTGLWLAALGAVVSVAVAHAQPERGAVEPPAAQSPESTSSAPATGGDEDYTLEKTVRMRDPFRHPTPKGMPEIADLSRVPELERYDLDKFNLIGIIAGLKKNKALVTTPDGKMHIVSERSQIGTRRGTVLKIAPGYMLVQERIMNLLGQEEKVDTVVKLREKTAANEATPSKDPKM